MICYMEKKKKKISGLCPGWNWLVRHCTLLPPPSQANYGPALRKGRSAPNKKHVVTIRGGALQIEPSACL